MVERVAASSRDCEQQICCHDGEVLIEVRLIGCACRPLYGAFFVKEFARAAHLFPSCFEHDGTLNAVAITIRGEPAFGARFNRATTLYPVGPRTRTMMQSCASAAKLRSGGPILPFGVRAKGRLGIPPPRTVIGVPSQAYGQAETVVVPSASFVHCAGRKTTPSGTMPSRMSRHRALARYVPGAPPQAAGFDY